MEILVAILLAILGIFLVGFLLTAFIASAPIVGSGLAVVFLIQWLFRLCKVDQMSAPSQLVRVVRVGFSQGKVSRTLDESQMQRVTSGFAVVAICSSIIMGTCFALGVGWILALEGFWFADEVAVSIVTCILGAVEFAWASAQISSGFREKLESSIRQRVEEKISGVNLSLEELDSLGKGIFELATGQSIRFPVDYVSSVGTFFETHKAELLMDITKANPFIAKQIGQAKRDMDALEQAIDQYEAALSEYKTVALEVNRCGSAALVALLDDIYTVLSAITGYLEMRNWSAFAEGIDFAMNELDMLRQNAVEFQAYAQEEESPGYDPYDVLGVSPEMRDDEIREVYRKLCLIYHPDLELVKDDERMKEINAAYEQIMQRRKA